MISKEFVLAGKAIFTVRVGQHGLDTITQNHYTFKVKHKPGTLYSKEVYFISLLTGPNNESDYTYMGVLDPINGWVRLTTKSKYTEDTAAVKIIRRILARLWKNEGSAIEAAGWNVEHCGFCCRCGRTLTTPLSIERGIGPECWKHMGIGTAHGTPMKEEV